MLFLKHLHFNENLGYFLGVKKQTTEMNVNTDNCCSLALSACHTAACRCFFVQEHAVPLYYKNSSQFRRFLQAEGPALSACCHWSLVPVQAVWAVLAAI